LFQPAQSVDVNASFLLIQKAYQLEDSIPLPRVSRWKKFYFQGIDPILQIGGTLFQATRNPSLRDSYWVGSTFIGNSTFQNEQLFYLQAYLQWQQSTNLKDALLFLPNYAKAGFFVSRASRLLGYDSLSKVFQGADLSVRGIEVSGRVRLMRLYAEGTLLAMHLESNSQWLLFQPKVQGKLSLFYENQLFKRATLVRISIDSWYQSAFYPAMFEQATQRFYPQSVYEQRPYLRMDISLTAKIKAARIFLKLIHWNEGLLSNGYYSVRYYPMLERTFSFGVNWDLFD
ncbi:MAG: putative porin, partial [Bacteroidia bacterium]|nr:putative porin [Bacteroidia bacterium]